MSSMYETIMNLPLFKGVSREQVSIFLERTPIHFSRYEDDELIASRDETVENVICIVNGKVRLIHQIDKSEIAIQEELGKENIICADRLFGLFTTYNCEVRSCGNCGIMKFSKEQYIELLKSNPIYLINFLNFLSLKSQRPGIVFQNYDMDQSLHRLAMQIILLTDRDADKVVVKDLKNKKGRIEEIINRYKKFFNRLANECIVGITDKQITIYNRNLFLEQVLSEEKKP